MLCRVLADGLEPFEAVANARLHHQLIPNQVVTENYKSPFPAENVTIRSPEYVITGRSANSIGTASVSASSSGCGHNVCTHRATCCHRHGSVNVPPSGPQQHCPSPCSSIASTLAIPEDTPLQYHSNTDMHDTMPKSKHCLHAASYMPDANFCMVCFRLGEVRPQCDTDGIQ